MALFAGVVGLVVAVVSPSSPTAAAAGEECRPDGLYQTPGVAVPYCSVYDTEGRESLGANHSRRVIGYFTSWRTGRNGAPAYLASDIPWSKVTHLNYAFAHLDAQTVLADSPVSYWRLGDSGTTAGSDRSTVMTSVRLGG